ncbi:hypothetical protein E3P99_02313 [Wallemia hederae]|uniref:ATP-dependent DNA ligase family profile domain-containing protein n=1 Tax=Wallemia hederae TaxID=1540922 RepID=A0A4T0FN58_9BASI|nr:hypothetical protein E3P99_02313 [Wallemia hederae]
MSTADDDIQLAIKLSMESYKREIEGDEQAFQNDVKRIKTQSHAIDLTTDTDDDKDDAAINNQESKVATTVTKKEEEGVVDSTSSSLSQPLKTSSYSYSPPTLPSPILFHLFTDACAECSSTKSRIEITNVLTNYLRTVILNDSAALLPSIWLFSHQLGPPYEPNELGIGGHVLNKSLKDVTSITPAKLRSLHNKLGDIGDVAYEATRNVISVIQPKPLTVEMVYNTFVNISNQKGSGSQETKTNLVKKLLVSAKGEQARYLMRALVQNLRIGAVRTTLSIALARAFAMQFPSSFHVNSDECAVVSALEAKGKRPKDSVETRAIESKLIQAEKVMKKVYARHPNYNTIVEALQTAGLDALEENVPVSIGTPVQPMLGAITRSFDDVLSRLDGRAFTSEAKLDGQRCQLHAKLISENDSFSEKGWKSTPFDRHDKQYRVWIRLFSRRLEDMTDKYPDICSTVLEMFKAFDSITSFVIDAEIAAVDDAGKVRPFQELANRSRKAVQLDDVHIKVAVYGFDCMLFNDEPLLNKSFRERRETLRSHLPPFAPSSISYARWDHVPSIDDTALDAITAFFDKCMTMKAEGIMVKLLDYYEYKEDDEEDEEGEEDKLKSPSKKSKRKALPATYEPDKRADSWLKVKKDYIAEIGDSIDLVPIGGWHGMGRKNKFWSPILLGVYDDEEGTYTAVCKCMSGFSDAFYESLNVTYAEDGPNTSNRPFPGVVVGGEFFTEENVGADEISQTFNPVYTSTQSRFGNVEVLSDITQSPVYPAAKGLIGEKGLSIRFPRFIRRREDKSIEQANTATDLARMYEAQEA